MCIERRRFSQTMASEWQTAFVVSHKMPWCALLTAVKNYNKSLKNCKTFSSRPRPRPRPRPNVQDQDQDQYFHFCPRGASRPRPWSRGLHHWFRSAIAKMTQEANGWVKLLLPITNPNLNPNHHSNFCDGRPAGMPGRHSSQ